MSAPMTSLPTSNTVTDVVVSQAAEIAKEVALPAAKFAAAHFLRSRAKGIVVVVVAASAAVFFLKRKQSSNTATEDDRPSFDGLQEGAVTEAKA